MPAHDKAGDFDIYLLAQSWAPHFCCVRSDRCTTVPWAYSATHLSLHGLWPGFLRPRENKTYPQSCDTKEKLLTSEFSVLPRDYIDFAPAFTRWNAKAHVAEVGDLARHEWKKHGTCSSLPPEVYFTEAMRAMKALPGKGTPNEITSNVGKNLPVNDLRSAYPKRVAILADKSCRLTELTTCWSKGSDGSVGHLIDCPEHVMKGRDTHCSSVLINQLGACLHADGKKSGRRERH